MFDIQPLFRCFFVVLIGCWQIAPAWSKTYYVMQQNTIASDTNPGTEARPWKTVAHAAEFVKPGDTVLIGQGVYREQMLIVNSGMDEDNRITFAAMPGQEAVLKGSVLLQDGWDADPEAPSPRHKILRRKSWSIMPSMIFDDNQPMLQIGDVPRLTEPAEDGNVPMRPIPGGKNDLFANSYYYDASSQTLYAWFRDYLTYFSSMKGQISRHLEVTRYGPVITGHNDKVSYITIRGLKIMHSNQMGKDFTAGIRTTGTHWIIEDCDISWNDFSGIALNYTDHIVRRCDIHHNGAVGITGRFNERVLIEDCRIHENNVRNVNHWWHAGGLKMAKSKGNTYRRLEVYRNVGSGIWFDISCDNNLVQHCRVGENSGPGIHYEISSGGQITDNIAYDNHHQNIYVSTSSDVLISNNLIYLSRSGQGSGISVQGEPRPPYQLKNNRIRNNIVVTSANVPSLIIRNDAGQNNISDFNLFWTLDASKPEFWPNYAGSVPLAKWQNAGQDIHSVVADPKLVIHDGRIVSWDPTLSQRQANDGGPLGPRPE